MKLCAKLYIGTVLVLASTTAGSAKDLKPFTFSLNVSASGGQVGFVYAKALGLYEQAGLDVTIQEGKGSATTAQIVATGQVDLAMADGPTVMQLRSKGAPLKIIAPVLQTNAYAIISRAEAGIRTAKDMEGKRIGIDPGTAMAALFKGIVETQKIDASKVQVINLSLPAQVGALLEKKVDAIAAGADFQGVQARANAETYDLMFSDVGIPTIGLSVFGREDKLQKNAAEVKAFLKAGFEGWDRARKDPKAAAEAVHAAYPSISADEVLRQLSVDLRLLCVPGSKIMGQVSQEIWNANFQIMTNYLQVPADKPITDYYTEAYLPEGLPSCAK
jgi:NitT/TauT family transport system substrate-binding protein